MPYSNFIQKTTGSWDGVFIIAAGANILAAFLALFVLKPWRARVVAASGAALDDAAAVPAVAPRTSGPANPPPVLVPAGGVQAAIARPVATAGSIGSAAAASEAPAAIGTSASAAERLSELRAANRELKQKLSAAIIAHDTLQPVTAEALGAENALLKERLAWFTAENAKLGWK